MEGPQTERVVRQLRELYRRYGYTQYRMSKFEPYDLYVRNKSFLVSEDILTFTDADGRLMALKPDVTLSIVKDAKKGGGLQKVCYSENVYRTSPMSRSFREIMQTGLECVGEIDLVAMGEVLLLAAKSLETVSGDYLLDVSHLGLRGCWTAPACPRRAGGSFGPIWERRTCPLCWPAAGSWVWTETRPVPCAA